MQNINTKTAPSSTNAQLYACLDNDNLPPERGDEVLHGYANIPNLCPERLVDAVDVNVILTEDPRLPVVMIRYERNPHEILAYRSRIINPIQRHREAIFVSQSPFDGSLWLSRDVEDIDVATRQYWLSDTLALSTYLQLIGEAITKQKLQSSRKLIQASSSSGENSSVRYRVEDDASTQVIQTRSGDSTTWELITHKHGLRTLRTVNPEEGR